MLLIISYLVVVNKCSSEALKADNFAVDVVVVVIGVMLLLWPCLLLVILYSVVVNNC